MPGFFFLFVPINLKLFCIVAVYLIAEKLINIIGHCWNFLEKIGVENVVKGTKLN